MTAPRIESTNSTAHDADASETMRPVPIRELDLSAHEWRGLMLDAVDAPAATVGLLLGHHANNDGSRVYLPTRYAGDKLGMTHRTVRKAVDELVALGFVELLKRGTGRAASSYRLTVSASSGTRYETGAESVARSGEAIARPAEPVARPQGREPSNQVTKGRGRSRTNDDHATRRDYLDAEATEELLDRRPATAEERARSRDAVAGLRRDLHAEPAPVLKLCATTDTATEETA